MVGWLVGWWFVRIVGMWGHQVVGEVVVWF